jgi:alpha-beta hydrolase superfamily lysophospholipase
MLPKINSVRWRWPVIALLSIAALAGCVNFDAQQRKWIFQASVLDTTEDAHIDGLDDVWIERNATLGEPKARIHGLWIAGPSDRSPVMLYLHGARRNVESNTFRIRNMQAMGFAVLAIDYRGFGRSTDTLPSEQTVDEDARAAWSWLMAKYPGRDYYIFGHSLGGAIAVRLATEVTGAKGLIVEGTFTSISDVFQTMRWGWLPITALITQRFDSVDRIASVKVPVLIVHGDSDSLIPPQLGRELYERAVAPKRFLLVEGGTHYSTNGLGRDQYRQALREMFGVGG